MVDVDDIRATFRSKAHVHSWYHLTWKGLARTLLFPFFWSWWRSQLPGLSWILFILYLTQIFSTLTFIHLSEHVEQITFAEAMFPVLLMFVLGVLQHHISCTDNTPRHHHSGRRSQYSRPESHWYDDDVQLPTTENLSQAPIRSNSPPPQAEEKVTSSPNRVEFLLSTDRNIGVDKGDDSSIEDSKKMFGRRGSLTCGDSRGESDNESGSDVSHAAPVVQRSSASLSNPVLQYKDNDGEEVVGLQQDCQSGPLTEISNVAGCIMKPGEYSNTHPNSSSSNSELKPEEIVNKRHSGADDSAFSETSLVRGIVDAKQPNIKVLSANLLTRKASSTSTSSVEGKGGGDLIDRVTEWRRGPSSSQPGSGALRRRKFSGKQQQSNDSDVPNPDLKVVENLLNPGPNKLEPKCKPILRNRNAPRRTSVSEGNNNRPSPPIESSNNKRQQQNVRRRGVCLSYIFKAFPPYSTVFAFFSLCGSGYI